MNDFRGVPRYRYPVGKIVAAIAGWLWLLFAAVCIALAIAGCAPPPPPPFPTYACFPVNTDRGPAMMCAPLVKENTP